MSQDIRNVIVYGLECRIYNISLQYSLAMMLEDLDLANKKETIRIMSGEANAELYNQVEDVLRKNCVEKELKFEVIAGPILSVSYCDGQKKNAIIDLAKAGFFDLHMSKIRRELHFRTIGNRLLRGELPHLPINYNGRLGYSIDIREFQDEEARKKVVFAIENRIKDFEAAKMFCERVPPEKIEERFTLLTNDEIIRLSEKASKKGLSVDMLPRDQIIKLCE